MPILLGLVLLLWAQEPSTNEKIQTLEQRVKELEEQVNAQKTPPPSTATSQAPEAAPVSAAPAITVGQSGLTVHSADGAYVLQLNGYIQADMRFVQHGRTPDASTFYLRRVRPVMQATIARYIELRLMPDFAQGTVVLSDAYLDLRYFPKASLRVGKYKTPFGLERLQSAIDMNFVERSLANNLVPNRDEGIQLYGDLGRSHMSYSLAVMNGTPDGAIIDGDSNAAKDVVARVLVRPLESQGFGVAYSDGGEAGALPTFLTSSRSTFFSYASGSAASGRRWRISPQGYSYIGPFGLLWEYVRTSQGVSHSGATGTFANHGWQVAGSYFLTGEKKSYRSAAPHNPVDPRTGGKGAFELTGRVSDLTIDPAVFSRGFADHTIASQRAREWIAGLNWHLIQGNKIVFNYVRTSFIGGNTVGNRALEQTFLTRFQISF